MMYLCSHQGPSHVALVLLTVIGWWCCPLVGALELGCRKFTPVGTNLTGFALGCPRGCPYAVLHPGDECSAMCVENQVACKMENPKHSVLRTGRNICTQCSVAYCEECSAGQGGALDTCNKCHDGFVLNNAACIPKYENMTVNIFLWIAAFLLFVIVLLFLCTGIENLREHMADDDTLRDQLLETKERNALAITLGRKFAFSARVLSDVSIRNLASEDAVGVGLPMFFNTQLFLIVASAMMFVGARWVEEQVPIIEHFRCTAGDGKSCEGCEDSFDVIKGYARAMSFMCFWLWVSLFLVSWAFCFYNMHRASQWDDQTLSSEDYTLKVKGLPKKLTSEKNATKLIQENLGVSAKKQLYGLSLLYNINHFDCKLQDPKERTKLAEHLSEIDENIPRSCQEMIDHLVEKDDKDNKWADERLCRKDLDAICQIDQRIIKYAMEQEDPWILGTGQAFMVFKTQEMVHMVNRTYKGFMLSKNHPLWSSDELSSALRAFQLVEVHPTNLEPTTVIWNSCRWPSSKYRRNLVRAFVSLLVGFIIFNAASYYVWAVFIRPYTQAGEVADQNDLSITLIGVFLALLNVIVNIWVFLESEGAGFEAFFQSRELHLRLQYASRWFEHSVSDLVLLCAYSSHLFPERSWS